MQQSFRRWFAVVILYLAIAVCFATLPIELIVSRVCYFVIAFTGYQMYRLGTVVFLGCG